MRINRMVAAAVVVGLFGCGSPPPRVWTTPSGVDLIYNDYDAAREHARASGRLLLVNFSSPTCAEACKIERDVLDTASLSAVGAGFVEARLQVDNVSRSLAREHDRLAGLLRAGERGIPGFVVVDPVTDEVVSPRGRPEPTAGGMVEFLRDAARAASAPSRRPR